MEQISDLFHLCPLVRYDPPVTEHVLTYSGSLFKNMAHASGYTNNLRAMRGWGHKQIRSQK